MFPTFSGNSRRPRNVNLSGQKRINPFTHALSQPTGAGASKAVADAQAERQKRQQERNELRSARAIQRVWRAHHIRRLIQGEFRHALQKLYSDTSTLSPDRRAVAAFPLLVASFRKGDDCQVLDSFAEDLARSDYIPLKSGEIPESRLWRLGDILISSLAHQPDIGIRVSLLTSIARIKPQAVLNSLGPYFRSLAALCSVPVTTQDQVLLVQAAVAAPLDTKSSVPATSLQKAYLAYATSFLSNPLGLLEQHIVLFSKGIDLDVLSGAVIEVAQQTPQSSTEPPLWLLAHLVDLQVNQTVAVLGTPLYLRAVYTLLSTLSGTIRTRVLPSAKGPSSLPDYLSAKIGSLADKDEVASLLEKLTASRVNAADQDLAGFLAGYALTLIRCFPQKADDIRMRLCLADIPTATGSQPAVQFFWLASSTTQLFSVILSSPKKTLEFLLRRRYFPASSSGSVDDSPWDREWRTVLLFLELHTFVMRLTDDEDFFSGLQGQSGSNINTSSPSHIRASVLPLDALQRLSLFLKNLAFTLNYNAAELLQGSARNENANKPATGATETYCVVAGVDFDAFKSLVTTSIQMLYERDSRRQFLPTDHWLMTTNFDMDSFLSAVVMEEQRQHELGEGEGDNESDEDIDMDDSDAAGAEADRNLLTLSSRVQPSRYAFMEKVQNQRKEARRERLLASIGPKLEILRNMPYALPFELRVRIFRQFVDLDKVRRRNGFIDPDQWRLNANQHREDAMGRYRARISRHMVFESAYAQFYSLGEGLKEPIQITFLDEYGSEEAGIDGGGVTKEFLMSVTKEVFTTRVGNAMQFQANKENALYPNPLALDQAKLWCQENPTDAKRNEYISTMLREFEFTGRLVGKCMYEGILLDVVFAGFFLLKWSLSTTESAYRASVNDLREMDEELYQGMLRLKNYNGDVSELDLNFTLEDQISKDGMPLRTVTRNLVPNGEDIPVTNDNRPLYISYVARHRLAAQPHQVTKAFLHGLETIIDPAWLRMFNQNELQRLVGGDSSEIDVQDLRKNTTYGGLYEIGDDGEEHASVKLFWEVVESLPDADRRLLLKFVTSTPRAPLLGFSQLKPPFYIRDAGSDETRLPSASTCVNMLKLPRYTNLETMRQKILYAVRSNSRFDLS